VRAGLEAILRAEAGMPAVLAGAAAIVMRLAGTSTAVVAAVVGLGTSELRTRVAAIVAALDGRRAPSPSSPLLGTARPRSTAA
jgi:hypothetical protein